jgi:hypothetical protein
MTLGHVLYAFHIILLLKQKPIRLAEDFSKADTLEVKA